jgi:group I intron endonuclease
MVIYKITNKINGKIYIGKSTKNDDDYMGSGISILRAIKKYGIENFYKEIIEQCHNIDDLNEKECFWIKHYKSIDRKVGYNIAEGGNGGNTRIGYSDCEMICYLKNVSDGLKNSEKYKKSVENKKGVKNPQHSDKMKELYKQGKLKIGVYTSKLTEETKKKISEKNKGKKRSDDVKNKIAKSKYKKVYRFDLNMVFIDEYLSIDDASKKCDINRCCISDVCNGRQKTAGGFKWSFTKEY